METKDFNTYCNETIEELNKKLTDIRGELKTLSQQEHIELPTGEELTKLRNSYRLKNKMTIKNRVLGISRRDLEHFMIYERREALAKKEYEVKSLIAEITCYKNSRMNGKSNAGVIKTYFDYAIATKKPIDEVVDFVLNEFRTNNQNNSVLDSLEKDIIKYFSDDNSIDIKDTKTVLFLIRKAFEIILKTDIYQYTSFIEQIFSEIEDRGSKKLLSSDEKYPLLVQRKAIERLKEYIENNKVVKVADDLNNFISLLHDAKIKEDLIDSYTRQMVALIKSSENITNRNIVTKELPESDLKLFLEAQRISAETEIEEQRELLNRLIKDIISICKYINMGIAAEEVNETREILFTKIELLRSQVRMINNPSNESSAFKYVTNEDGIPNIIRNIETIDIINYASIYTSLVNLSQKQEHIPAFQLEGINFYLTPAKDTDIIYTLIRGQKVLVGATTSKDISKIAEEVMMSSILSIVKMNTEPENVDNVVDQNYESLLIKLLDLDNSIKSPTLKK